MKTTPQRLTDLHDTLLGLQGDENALIRTAVRLAINELDLAALTTDPNPHLYRVNELLDAALNPTDEP